jgi:DNA-binding CsgD family transcriptional regulator
VKGMGQRVFKLRGATTHGDAALSALDIALGAIDAPAFIVDMGGTVLHANSNAQALLARDRHGVARSLAQAIAGAPADLPWDVTPLRDPRKRHGFLAILRGPRRDVTAAGADAICAAINRWRLTPRQAQVLDLVARGYTNALVADELGIGEGTVEFHLSAVFDKAGVDTRAKLIILILQL